MILQKKQLSIPIHDFLNSESASINADFSLNYKKQNFHFNSTYLISISQTIRDIFISDPLAYEYNIDIQIKNKMKDIISILSNSTFQVSSSNYNDCFSLAVNLRSDQLFSFIWERIHEKLKPKEILKYAVLAYKNRIELPESLELRFAEEFQDLFYSGLITEISFDECYALSLTEWDIEEEKEYFNRINSLETPKKDPVYNGIDKTIGTTPPGLVYLILKKYPTYILSYVRNVIVNRYVDQPDSKSRNLYLKHLDPNVKNDGNELCESYKNANLNDIRIIFNSLKSENNFSLDTSFSTLFPLTVPSQRKFDYYKNNNGIMKTLLRPIIKAPNSLSPKYPIMNIFLFNDKQQYVKENNSFVSISSYVSREFENNFIEFDFSPYYIKLESFIMLDPPQSWELLALYPNKPDEPKSWFLIDKHNSKPNAKNERLIFKDVKNLEVSCSKFKLQQPEDTFFTFSLNYIDFFGSVEKGSNE